jgi:hypothetical protein
MFDQNSGVSPRGSSWPTRLWNSGTSKTACKCSVLMCSLNYGSGQLCWFSMGFGPMLAVVKLG